MAVVDHPTRTAAAGAPVPRRTWRELVAHDADGLVSQTPEWLDAMARSGYEDASRMYETLDGGRAVLPLARRCGSVPRWAAPLASMPAAWGMGGVLADGPVGVRDLARIVDDLGRLSAVQISVRPNPLHAQLWAEATRGAAIAVPRRAHVLDLAGGPDVVWDRRFASAARRAVRKALAAGVEVRCGGGPELLCDFRRLWELSIVRWAAVQHEPLAVARLRAHRRDPPAKFMHVAAVLPGALRVRVAYRDGAPLAGIIVLLGANASYTRGAMDKSLAARLGANEFLHWSAIQEACAAGCRHYHLGETGSSASLARFKEKLGARPVAYAEYRFERLPITRSDHAARALLKRAVGFRDA